MHSRVQEAVCTAGCRRHGAQWGAGGSVNNRVQEAV